MELRPLLAGLDRFDRVPALVQALGHAPVWDELDPRALPVPVVAAAVAGRAGDFEWLAVETTGDGPAAAGLSRWFAARGRLTGVLALDPATRSLTLALTLEHTGSLRIALDHPDPADLERLHRLALAGGSEGVGYALRALEAIAGEDAGKRFFRAFAASLETMAESLTGEPLAELRRSLALIQLTRVLVLYFVQAKGWLDGRADFLRRAVDDALATRRRLHRDLFRPLFFGTLNRPLDHRGRARAFGRIPFLNGGLFEPHPLERAWRGDVPNSAWQQAFDRVFERFHFTVHEAGEPGRIAPDMLGRVFEGLMAPEDRRASGAYYTPAALVARLVDQAVSTWLGARLGCAPEAAETELSRQPLRAAELLDRITVLDPAVGSGAFLLGALERLAGLHRGTDPPATVRRRILARNLFGVDRNPMAVRLAELRLWLAVIAEEQADDVRQVAPLPNLDGVVRQGDSLLDPGWFLAGLTPRPAGEPSNLAEARHRFIQASGAEKREWQRRLRHAEARALAESLDLAEQQLARETGDLLRAARAPTLFGVSAGLDRDGSRRLRSLRARLTELRRLRRRVRREGGVPWFQFECQFGDVMARGGFDLVVGNPPWVRAEELPEQLRHRLGRRYRWWAGSGRGFRHQPDLAVAFVERSVELLAPGGVTALLLPAKVATAGYASRMRSALAERCTVHRFADLRGDPTALFEATIYPAALVAERCPPPEHHTVRLSLNGTPSGIPQRRLQGGAPWMLGSPELFEILASLSTAHPALGERLLPRLGLKTGANGFFLEPPAELEPALVRAAVRGRDIAPFVARPRLRLFFPCDARGEPLARLPRHAAGYVRAHESLLRQRTDYRGGEPWVLFRVRPALARHRVIWADIARRLAAAVLSGPGTDGFLPLNSCYVLSLPEHDAALALAAWLNCTWLRAAAHAAADPASGGFARFNARVVAQLPLPEPVLADGRLMALAGRGARGEPVQEELDDVCAEHLALGARARAVLAAAPGTGPDDRRRSAARRR